MNFMATIAWRYGGLARIPVRGKDLYLASSPEIVRELLVTHRQRYVKNTREGEAWKRQRLMMQPLFKTEPVEAQLPWMAEMTVHQVERWHSYRDSRAALDVEPEFLSLAQKLAGLSLFGRNFGSIAARFCHYATAVKQNWPRAPASIWEVLMPARRHSLTPFDSCLAELDGCVFKYISQQAATDFKDCGMLQYLAHASQSEGQPLTALELRDQLLTLFFAGHETTATALCWIPYLLAEHPDVYERLIAEIDSVLHGRIRMAEASLELHYTEQVVQEALRLYSPIHSISRVSLEEHSLGGYRIPAGATVCISMYATHRLPDFWPDPERFDPTRFNADRSEARHRFSYLPFAAGHRNCIGSGQALVELKLIVALIAQRYRLRLVTRHRVEPAPGTTM